MKINKRLVLFFIGIIAFSSIKAQLLVDGEFRTRFQAMHGWKTPAKANTDAIFGFDQRTRINLDYKSDNFRTRFSLQDARIFGSEDITNSTGIIGSSNALGIYEAWAEVNIGNNSRVRVGRQEWNYNDMRIFCYRNWWTTGMSYDGVLYQFSKNGNSIDIGISYNADGEKNGSISTNEYSDRIKTINFLNLNKKLNDNSYVALMFSMAGKQDTSITSNPLLVKGTHAFIFVLNHGKKSHDGLTAKLSAYYQHGTDLSRKISNSDLHKNVSAYLFDAQVGFRMINKKLEFTIGSEIISGNDGQNTNIDYIDTQHSFDLLYSSRFPYYAGNLNHYTIFTSSKSGTNGGGFADPYFKMLITPKNGRIVSLSVFMPRLTTNVINSSTGLPYENSALGTYIDLCYTHKFSEYVEFRIGGSYAVITDTKAMLVFGSIPNLGQNYYGYTALTVKPNFYDSSKKE